MKCKDARCKIAMCIECTVSNIMMFVKENKTAAIGIGFVVIVGIFSFIN